MAEPKTAAGDDGGKKPPTAQEAMFFFAIVKHTKSKADIDWNAVAEEAGFKNAEVAKVRFGQIRRKLGLNMDSSPRKAPSTPAKVRKTAGARGGARAAPKGKKGKAKKEEATEDEDSVKNEASVKNEDHYCEGSRTPVKSEEDDAEAQLQADMDAMINTDPF